MSSALPSGTVTFLFTDVEGSTMLLRELGADAFAQALSEHRRVLRAAFAAHGGVEVDTQGDAFFVAFSTAPGALDAAREAQRILPIPVRMGLHTGTPHLTGDGYLGEDVHLGARIAAAGHGGKVLLSKTTRELVPDPALDLGEHRLKDFPEPVWLFQLGEEAFPPLRTISNTNLPRPASSFVGRRHETAEVVSLFRDGTRLVTLAGPGARARRGWRSRWRLSWCLRTATASSGSGLLLSAIPRSSRRRLPRRSALGRPRLAARAGRSAATGQRGVDRRRCGPRPRLRRGWDHRVEPRRSPGRRCGRGARRVRRGS